MRLKLPSVREETGFIAGELLITIVSSQIFIGLMVMAIIATGLVYFFQEDIAKALKNASKPPEAEKVYIFKSDPNVFPSRPVDKSQPVTPPKEPVRSEYNRVGGPTSTVTIAGEWHGRYTATNPPMFKGKGGGWEALLTENSAGDIRGTFKTDFGISGNVVGKRAGDDASWKVGSGNSGLGYKGTVKGNTISGQFWGEIFQGQNASGTFFGGRKVNI